MIIKIIELTNIVISAVVGGMYWGPWLALTRSLQEFDTKTFLIVARRLNKNMAPIMTVLSPLSLLTTVAVLIFTYNDLVMTFYFTLAGFASFLTAVVVTMTIEVPIVKQIITWQESALPANWKELRDRWGKFHIVRVTASIIGITLLLAGVLFNV